MSKTLYVIVFTLLLAGCDPTKVSEKHEVDLGGILDKYSKENYALNPLDATANGVNDYNDQLAIDVSEEYEKNTLDLNNRYLDTLKIVIYDSLSGQDKISFDIFQYKLSIQNEQINNKYRFYRPVNQFVFSFPQNFAMDASGGSYVPFNNETDYRNFISRMKAFQTWVDQAIANLQMGLELKDENPKACMLKVPPQLKPLFETEGDENIFYKPLLSLPADMDSVARVKLISDYSSAIDTYIKPSYKKLSDFIETTYIPQTRETTGLIDNANGKEEYAYWLRYYTTTDITADEIFDLGLLEVARIRTQMDSIRVLTGFIGDLQDFFQYLKTDPKFFPFKTEEDVLNRYRSFEARMEPKLSELFNMRPKAKFEVRAVEKFMEAGANAYYMQPARDGSRPGIFYETVRDPRKYNYIDMESLFMHEAIPGHHYQKGLQLEADISEFRKTYTNSAYGEGWALYAESLGTELGMYTDPYQYMGRLNNEMERAVRLVVDAGMHHKGWSREQAIAYVLENQPVTAFVAEQRIERYMVEPGQAVSYKVGELKIKALREKAKQALGDKFDIRAFHDQILKDGRLPLAVLEKKIDRWIENER